MTTRPAWLVTPAVLVAGAVVVILTVGSFGYGYNRDELYFLAAGQHLAWGYPDQPPVTPVLAWLGNALSPGSLWALRVPATLAAAVSVLLVTLTAREMGATRRGQLLAAVSTAASGYVLITGHVLFTVTTDVCFSAAVVWLSARLIRTQDRRLLVVLGAVVGLGLLNKALLALLVLALLFGVALTGPRSVLRGRWLGLGVVIAVGLWLPNLIWQARHGWPQLQMAQVHAGEDYLGGRWGFIPYQFVLLGLPLAPIWVAGLVRLLRTPTARAFRAFALAYLAMVAILLISGGRAYYLAGGYPALLAAGGIATDRWLAQAASRVRLVLVAGALSLAAAINAVVGLPLVPANHLADTPILAVYHDAGEQLGWPELARTVARVYRSLPEPERARAVIVASNYGQAGALRRYGPALGLPPVYSGHNAFANWERPPEGADVVIVVGGHRTPPRWTSACRTLHVAGRVDNDYHLANEQRGTRIRSARACAPPGPDSGPGYAGWPSQPRFVALTRALRLVTSSAPTPWRGQKRWCCRQARSRDQGSGIWWYLVNLTMLIMRAQAQFETLLVEADWSVA